jgi:hypothetical protein
VACPTETDLPVSSRYDSWAEVTTWNGEEYTIQPYYNYLDYSTVVTFCK